MRGSLIYSHDSGLAFEIERYEDMSRVGQKMWRYRQRDMNHDWSQDWSRPDDCIAAIDDAHVDLLPRDDDTP